MSYFRTTIVCIFLLTVLILPAHAENAVIASGAGYKKMVNALNTAYQHDTGRSVEFIFGNMARVTTLARESGKVDILLGDQAFLHTSQIPMKTRLDLGQGRLVLAFAKSSPFNSVSDLDNPEAKRIALPDTSKAIYGKAAREFLQSSGRLPAIKSRLVEVSTVPQVFSYLATDEVDMGFLNLTHALNVADKLGSYVLIDDKGYSKIVIIAGLLKDCAHEESAQDFLRFLATPAAKTIMQENGL